MAQYIYLIFLTPVVRFFGLMVAFWEKKHVCIQEFGEEYEASRRKIPMIFPIPVLSLFILSMTLITVGVCLGTIPVK